MKFKNKLTWQKQSAEQLVRYEALFNLLDEIHNLDKVDVIAGIVARQWKYFANIAAWRLLVKEEESITLIETNAGQAKVSQIEKSKVLDWDLFALHLGRPIIYDTNELESLAKLPTHLQSNNLGQVQILHVYRNESCVGILTATSRKVAFNDLDNKYIKLFLNYFVDRIYALMLQDRIYKVLHMKATRDALTGILNRGAILEQLDSMLALGKRKNLPVSLIILDIDLFKQINDSYGHIVGDSVIRELALRLAESTRLSDCVGRYGGEEFMFVLYDCDIHQALLVAERVHAGIGNKKLTIQTEGEDRISLSLTISLGLTSTEKSATYKAVNLIREADSALYVSKNKGRNRITIYD